MKKILVLLSLIASPALAQTGEQTAVRATIDRMFDGMRKIDTVQFRSVFAPGATLRSIGKNKEGITGVQITPIPAFIAAIGKQKPGALDERLGGYDIKIDGDMAVAWTPYSFFLNGKQSHCGVNSFTLVKLSNEWKILSIIDTRRVCQ
ncbi:nuclear transport factor 2 family protein [Tellurirhabdus rosea]|uniref:nuclear transport factor 2 family protein n=1 Tax=Tellurirhabdus rosea TaxID=2674997 RepID=UPI00225760CE|nr:nuclear transport factor 2 family protein [Tellurirhabdus rosea]